MPTLSDDRGHPGFEAVFCEKPSVLRQSRQDRCRGREGGRCGGGGGGN